MKGLNPIIVLLIACTLNSCSMNNKLGHHVRKMFYPIYDKRYQSIKNSLSYNITLDSIQKRDVISNDTLSGQLIATQSMLYFSPDHTCIDLHNDSIICKELYEVSRTIKINGRWTEVDLQIIQALDGIPYRYLTKKNKYNVCSEHVSTARINGIDSSNTLYVIPCKVIFYLRETDQKDNWCVYFNDTLFDFECFLHSSSSVEVLSPNHQ